MKRSEINRAIREAADFFRRNGFALPAWAERPAGAWQSKGAECAEIRRNAMGWDITDFGKGDFAKEGLTLVTLRNGNPAYDRKCYCEKIMMVREGQVTPLHFHWHKMEDIINRAGGTLCMRLWRADSDERKTDDALTVQIDGETTSVRPGETLRLAPGQSICYEPYVYHTFWAEDGDCMVGEVSMVNDDAADNRFFEPLGRFPEIVEDEPAAYLLCNEYPASMQ